MATRLVHVVFDALDVRGLASFWSKALGWRLAEEFFEYDEGVLQASDGTGLEVICVPTQRPKGSKNRIHLDLCTMSADDQKDVLRRLLFEGASRVDIGQGEVPWVVLADPEGNEFCVTAPNEAGSSRLGAIAFDARDPVAQGAFWSAATGWVVEAREEWGVALRHPLGQGPALTLGPPVAQKKEKSRVHLDVAPFAHDDHGAEVERLLSLGADRVDIGQGDVPWVVLADPEGNEFCILTPR